MLTRQRIKLQQSTNTDRLRQTSGQVNANQYHRGKIGVSKVGRKQRKYQPYLCPEVKTQKTYNNKAKNNEEKRPKTNTSQQTLTTKLSQQTLTNKGSNQTLTAKLSQQTLANKGSNQTLTAKLSQQTLANKGSNQTLTAKLSQQTLANKASQQTQTKLNNEKQVKKKKSSGTNLNDLKAIDTTVVYKVEPGTRGCLAVVNDRVAWCRIDYAGTIALFNTRGRVVQKLKLDLQPIDISVNSNNDLICCEFKGRYIWKLANKKQEILADLYPFRTQCHCWTSNNEILVGLQRNYTVNKVVRIAPDGKILQTIQKDKNHKNIFTDLSLITENINKDICVVDNYNSLIVLDKDGKMKFKFLYTSDDGSRIFRGVYGIACDSLGCILLSDPDDSCLHMISGDGQYLQKILTQPFGVEKPWDLGTDNKNQLWIVDNHVGNVIIIKYRS